NNSTIFLFEHLSKGNVNSTNLTINTFNTITQMWTNPNISGNLPQPRQEMVAVVDKAGKIYISCGYEPFVTQKTHNDTYILDSMSLTWYNGPPAPVSRSDYTATLLSNGVIVYIGGTNDDGAQEIKMNNITIYNTNNGSWSTMIASGDYISDRQSHSAVLSKDGFIIIYGGGASISVGKFDITTNPNNKIYLMDTSNYTWVSSIPTTTTATDVPTTTISIPKSTNVISPVSNSSSTPLIPVLCSSLSSVVII
ncbi:7645_t:CDS:2, partial [Dentiscutata heterogama]